MAIRVYKKVTNGRRNASVNLHSEVTKKSPEKSLLAPLVRGSGRNVQGKITIAGRGGGHKRRYRKIDFRRNKDGIAALVVGILIGTYSSIYIASAVALDAGLTAESLFPTRKKLAIDDMP